jgi:hypothetical protein
MASLAMRMPSDLGSSGLGSVQRRFQNEIGNEFVLTRTGNEKRKPFKLRLVNKKDINDNNYNKFMF